MNRLLFGAIVFCFATFVKCSEYAYLPHCGPGVTAPVAMSREMKDETAFVILQVHEPATERQLGYMHRRRFTVSYAARGIAADPIVDFKRRKTLFFLDGYMDSGNQPTARLLMGNFAALGYNVIGIDAQRMYSMVFPLVVRMSLVVADFTGEIMRDLLPHGLKAADIELVGISLGGQVLSLVAKSFTRLTGQRVSKIYSLDPGGPCYTGLSSKYHLTPTDADFVQVIHTANDGFGMADAMGHVDFYINGGEWQFLLNTGQPVAEDLLSHVASAIYFYTSILSHPDEFVGIKCKSVQQAREHKCYDNPTPYETNVMGFKADPTKPGIYYIPARGVAPLYPEDGWMKNKTIYPLIYNDAFSNVENFELKQRVLDLNISPPIYTDKTIA